MQYDAVLLQFGLQNFHVQMRKIAGKRRRQSETMPIDVSNRVCISVFFNVYSPTILRVIRICGVVEIVAIAAPFCLKFIHSV